MAKKKALKTLEVPTRQAWRDWLSEHHDAEDEIWLVYKKGDAGEGWIQYGESVEEALCFGWVDGLVKRLDDVRYLRRFSPRKPKSKWSASNKKRIAALLKFERPRVAVGGAGEGSAFVTEELGFLHGAMAPRRCHRLGVARSHTTSRGCGRLWSRFECWRSPRGGGSTW